MTTKKNTSKKGAAVSSKGSRLAGAATAESILGHPVAPENNRRTKIEVPAGIKPEWAKYYRILMTLHERLVTQKTGLAKESAEVMDGYSLHMADSGTDNFDRDFALSLLSSDQDAIYEIEEAIKRIQKGTYGKCELTNKPIPKARLDAIPWTRFTVEAQAQLEREGALRQRRLGALGSVEIKGADGAGESEEEPDETEEKPNKRRGA